MNRTRWEQALEACLRELGKSEDYIASDRLTADWKPAIAAKLRRERSVSNLWLGEKLNMGKPRSVTAISGKYVRERKGKCDFARLLKKLIIDH